MKSTASTKICEIVPDISLMKKMASISGTIASRILELVDNSIDAKVEGKKLQIDVNIVKKGNKQYIEIADNGCGMNELAARSFFRLGDSQKAGKNKIGRFGLGSKVAILGIGNTCTVSTKPFDEPYSIVIHFDIQKFSDWKIDYVIKDNKEAAHGTKIKIEDLTIRIGNMERFCQKLQEQLAKTYKHFLDSGDVEIRVNQNRVTSNFVELLPEMFKNFDFEVNGKRVRGWCGALKTAGVNWKFGFDLISNGRIIKSNDFLSRQAHTALARLCGEVHLDDFGTDVHKTDFIRHSGDFEEMQERLINVELADLISKISKLTNKEVFEKYQEDMAGISRTLNRVLRTADFLEQIDIDGGVFKKMKKKAQESRSRKIKPDVGVQKAEEAEELYIEDVEASSGAVETKIRKRHAAGLVIQEPMGVALGFDQPAKRWTAEENDDAIYLSVEVNLDHPAYQNDETAAAVHMKSAMLEALSEFILSEEKRQNSFLEDEVQRLNQIKDMLLRRSLTV